MCRRNALCAAAAAALVILACLPAAATAQVPATVPCGAGAGSPLCQMWTGKVTFIGDGDTLSVDLAGDGTKKPVHVRVTGINAMEESVYTNVPKDRKGECHAGEATARLESLVKAGKGRVRLLAQNPASTSRGRLKRAVSVLIRGRYRDVGRTLLNEGHALMLAGSDEWAWNVSYGGLVERAAAAQRGIWNPAYCRSGPSPRANLRVWVNWDAPGSDSANPEGEWVKIRNYDPVNAVPVGGWWVRDSALRRYTLPPAAVVPAGGSLTVFVGVGEDTPTEFYWGLSGGVFDNVLHDGHGKGDGGYLFDPDGDLRAFMNYPCRRYCTDPLQGAVEVAAAYRRNPEYVTLTNGSQAPVDLEGYRIDSRPHGYTIGADSVLAPGERMRVTIGGDPLEDTRLDKHWDIEGPILGNGGDRVRLQTLTDIVIGCRAWGSMSC